MKGTLAPLLAVAGLASSTVSAPLSAEEASLQQKARIASYAECVVQNAPEFAEQGMRDNWTGDLFVPELPRQLWNKCERGGITVAPVTLDLRYAIAWALIRHEGIAASPHDFSAVLPLRSDMAALRGPPPVVVVPAGQSEAYAAKVKAEHERDALFASVGECAVRGKSEQVRAMLLDSDDPSKLDQIIPTVQSCTPPGTPVTFERDALRGLLAWIYVRLALASQVPQNTPQN